MPAVDGAPELIELGEGELGPLVTRARRLLPALGRPRTRRLLGVTGPPGVGKSTLAAAVTAALAPEAVLVSMDGFHLAGAELRRLGRHERKGALDTFDGAGFVSLLRRLRDPDRETVYAPRFDRHLEEAIAGAVPVPPQVPLVVTEGNYLLVDTGVWAAVSDLLDEVWYLEVDEAVRVDRLTSRHVAHGRPPQVAAARARGSDQRNADLIATNRHRAHLMVRRQVASPPPVEPSTGAPTAPDR